MLTLLPTSRLSARGALTAAWTEGRAIARADLDSEDGVALEPRYRLLDDMPRSPSEVQAVLAQDMSKPSRPVYRSGGGPLAAPPELARQPPFRNGEGENGLSRLVREASERFQRLPQELVREATERFQKLPQDNCVIS